MSDEEWQAIKRLMPWPAWLHGNGGRPEKYCRRLIMDAIRYVVDNGCTWRNLPADFLVPWRTIHAIFTRWRTDGDLHALHNDLREHLRLAEGRQAEPSAGIIDSQSLRAAETVATSSRGYDAAKKVQGTKRHIVVDTLGLLVVMVTAAGVQDRDGAKPALERLRDWYERISLIWADSAYAGKLVTWAQKHVRLTLEIVKRSDDVSGFVVLPRRWVVERTLSWICQRRRCVRDYERLSEHHEAMVLWAMIILMGRRLARSTSPQST
ncbi:IS5 family transposase [Streptosporangium sp. G11]|uniref:IS5 family transposase n=1 Tax=Streptosporangium sp. G11 TaxID=3436926 RepID=UPI003EBFA77A